jgi:hypothetical protein
MVPRTRKISISGGTRVVRTRSSSLMPCRVRASGGRAGQAAGLDQRDEEDVADVQRGQRQPRNEGAFVHVADRFAELVGHDDQHQRRRDDLRQRAGGGDDAGGQPLVVAVAQHDRQRDQAHRDHRGGDDAGRRGEQGADEDHRVGEAAAHRAEELADGVEQVLGHARAFEDEAHEGEEGDGEQRVVAHDAEDALGQRLEERRLEQAELDAEQPEDDAVGGEREGDRIAEKEEEHEGAEHQRRHVGDDPFHQFFSLASAAISAASSCSAE